MKQKKVLVLGATGAMGQYLVPLLAERGFQVDACALDALEFHSPERAHARRERHGAGISRGTTEKQLYRKQGESLMKKNCDFRSSRNMERNWNNFTLIELLIVIAIITTL